MYLKLINRAACAFLSLTLSTTTVSAETALHVAHDQAESGTLHVLFTEFKRLASEKTNGEIKVRVTCCGKLGDNERNTESVRIGTLDGTAAAFGNLGGYLPKIALLSAPYLIESAEHLAKVVDPESDAFAEMKRITEESGELVFGGFFVTGVRSVYTSKGPVTTPSDMAGMRMRVMSNDVQMSAWGTIGASPTSMAFSELYTGLMSGVVDAAENSPMFYYNTKHFEQAPYFSLTNHQYAGGVVMFSRAYMDALSPELRAAVLEASYEASEISREYDTKANQEFMEKLIEEGVKINEVDVPAFVELSRPLHDKLAKDVGAEVLLAAIRKAAK